MARNGASFSIAWRARRETALAGWGGRIRTSVWRNSKAGRPIWFRCRFFPNCEEQRSCWIKALLLVSQLNTEAHARAKAAAEVVVLARNADSADPAHAPAW